MSPPTTTSTEAYPLHAAVEQHDAAAVQALLDAGHDPNGLDQDGQPPLRYLLAYGLGFGRGSYCEDVLKVLLAGGADSKVANVAETLFLEAWEMVTASGEANYAHLFAELIGIDGREVLARRAHRRRHFRRR